MKRTENISMPTISRQEIAELLRVSPEYLDAFEKAYQTEVLAMESPDSILDINAKQASAMHKELMSDETETDRQLTGRIVRELLSRTLAYDFDGHTGAYRAAVSANGEPVSAKEVMALPAANRPQLTGRHMVKDTNGHSYEAVMDMYKIYLGEHDPKKKSYLYGAFRQGLDLLDLDPILYEIIGTNPASMGYWFPAIAKAASAQGFFRVPKTTVIRVPITLLQLTRLDYSHLTRATMDIVNRYCQQAFRLDEEKEYFIKTGTYSSKFDFRNAHVQGGKEVQELGEYLLFIHHQALQYASPLNRPVIYGMSTTNEWVVREWIPDKEKNPSIYKGLPLHTEYRVFADMDTKQVIGLHPYWDPDVMKKRFSQGAAGSPHDFHDYAVYSAYENTIMGRYDKNKDTIREKAQDLLGYVEGLSGQWSIDIMQNGDDFWLIDMAPAKQSAFVGCVPKHLLRDMEEDWIPKLGNIREAGQACERESEG